MMDNFNYPFVSIAILVESLSFHHIILTDYGLFQRKRKRNWVIQHDILTRYSIEIESLDLIFQAQGSKWSFTCNHRSIDTIVRRNKIHSRIRMPRFIAYSKRNRQQGSRKKLHIQRINQYRYKICEVLGDNPISFKNQMGYTILKITMYTCFTIRSGNIRSTKFNYCLYKRSLRIKFY